MSPKLPASIVTGHLDSCCTECGACVSEPQPQVAWETTRRALIRAEAERDALLLESRAVFAQLRTAVYGAPTNGPDTSWVLMDVELMIANGREAAAERDLLAAQVAKLETLKNDTPAEAMATSGTCTCWRGFPRDYSASPSREAACAVHGAGLNQDNDTPDQWSAAIDEAHPTRSGSHKQYGIAMTMVSHRHSKGSLVALVNWLLTRVAK